VKIFFLKKQKPKTQIPGEIIIEKHMTKPYLQVIDYDKKTFEMDSDVQGVVNLSNIPQGMVRWIDVQGLGDKKLLEDLKKEFKIHPLVMEDVINIPQRVKCDFFEDYIFLVLKMFYKNDSGNYEEEQLSLVMGRNYVITFQEKKGDCFDSLRNRIKSSLGIIRNMGADYLCYAMMDTILDNYYPFLNDISGNIEALEEKIIKKPGENELQEIQYAQKVLISLKRELWPTREVLNQILKRETSIFGDKVHVYFRDCHDHLIQILEFTESLKEGSTELMNTYLSVQGNKLNEIMKVLTIISTIFIPLSFLAGVYGMNFINMPELTQQYGYFIIVGIMAVIAICMLLWFKRKGWIGKNKKKNE